MRIQKLNYEEIQYFTKLQRQAEALYLDEVFDDELPSTANQKAITSMDLEQRLLVIQDIHLHGGYVIGAFDKDELVGLAALDCQYISGFRLRLAELVVVDGQRDTAITLLNHVKAHAKQLEAESVYICVEASKKATDFYTQQGAKSAEKLDAYLQQLYAVEKHFEIRL